MTINGVDVREAVVVVVVVVILRCILILGKVVVLRLISWVMNARLVAVDHENHETKDCALIDVELRLGNAITLDIGLACQ